MKTKLVPFTFETFPKGIVYLRDKGAKNGLHASLVINISENTATTSTKTTKFTDMEGTEISTDLCKTWKPFGVVKEVEDATTKRLREEYGHTYFYIVFTNSKLDDYYV